MASMKDKLYTNVANRLDEEMENNKRLNCIIEDQNALIIENEKQIGLDEKKLDELEN